MGILSLKNVFSTDLMTFDLIHVAEASLTSDCGTEKEQHASWHQWLIWKYLKDETNRNLSNNQIIPSITAELNGFKKCNSKYMKEISSDFENGTHALHIQQNRKVFQALQKSFLTIDIDFKGFNEIAWEFLEELQPINTDRKLLTDLLEKINSAHHQVLTRIADRNDLIAKNLNNLV